MTYIAQNDATKWYFGNGAGLDFMTNPPTILTNGAMAVTEGCASVANANGNLLFYTDGMTIWNQTHMPMANGTGLSGYNTVSLDGTSSQSSLILKQPGSNTIYYVFTVKATSGTPGLCYSIVDMSLAAGMGSVTVKNATLFAGSCAEKITGTRHCNGVDYWVMTHDWNSTNFRAHLLTATGINTTAVVSPVGFLHGAPLGVVYGCMKISPNSRKLGIVNSQVGFEILDFDNTTGVVSNSFSVPVNNLYGCEFSPDGTKFYIGTTNSGGAILAQYDLCAGSTTAIIASQYTTGAGSGQLSSFQLAPDGKIYIGKVGQLNLPVINNPNAGGSGCNFSLVGQSINPKLSQHGLPNFASHLFLQRPNVPPFTYTINNAVACQTATFNSPGNISVGCAASGYSLAGYSWNFGDPPSGSSNTSTLSNPVHVYTSLGTYTAQLVLHYTCGGGTDTLKQVVNVNQPCISVSSTSITCASLGSATVMSFGGTGPFSYTWIPTTQSGSVASGLAPGTYTILVHDASSNITSTSTTVFTSLIPLSGNVSATSSLSCNGAFNGSATVNSLTGGSGNQNYVWTNGTVTYTNSLVNTLGAGTWSLTVTDALTACQINSVFTIAQPPALTLNISASSATACVGTVISFTATSNGGNPGYSYAWIGGPVANTYSVSEPAGNYVYTVNTLDANNCPASHTVQADFIVNPVISVNSISVCPMGTFSLISAGATSYTWNGFFVGNTFTSAALTNTIHTVVGSALGCTAIASSSITLLPVPVATVGNNSPICNGQNLQLNASGGLSYSWSGPQSFISFQQTPIINQANPNNSGVYNLTVTAANSCTSLASTTVIVHPSPTISAVAGTTCVNDAIFLTVTSLTGSTFYWSGPNSFTSSLQNPIISNVSSAETGNYTIYVTSSAGCTNSAVVFALVNQLPILTVSNTSICPLETGTLSVSGANSYTWSNSTTGSTLLDSPSSNAQYTVTGSSLGCTAIATASIVLKPVPSPFIQSNSPACEGSLLSIAAYGGTSFAWNGPSGFSSSAQNPTFNPVGLTQTGVYTATVTAINGCTAATSTTVQVNPTPTLSASGSTVCTSGTLHLSANSVTNSTYQWTGPQNFASAQQNPAIVNPNINQTGNYSVKVTSAQGCTNTATVHGSVTVPPSLTVSLSGTGSLCAQALNGSPNTLTLSSQGAMIYTLSTPNSLGQNPSGTSVGLVTQPPASGTFVYATATLVGSNGVCTNSTTLTFTIVPNPTLSINSHTPVICAGKNYTYTSQGADSYTWGPNSPNLTTYTSAVTVANPTVTSVYSVVGGSLGCYSSTQTSTLSVFPLPNISFATPNPSVCLNDKITLIANASVNGTNAAVTDYTWNPYQGLNDIIGQSVTASPTLTQSYTVTASVNNCTNSAKITVNVLDLPKAALSLSKENICLNETVTLSGQTGEVYEYYGPNDLYYQGQTVNILADNLGYSGFYMLTVTDKNGCKNTDVKHLNIYQLPTGSLLGRMEGCRPLCTDLRFETRSSSSVTAAWSYGEQQQSGNRLKFCFNEEGVQTIRGFFHDQTTGCDNEEKFYVTVYEKPQADFDTEPKEIVEGMDVVYFSDKSKGEEIKTFNWYFENNNGFTSRNKNLSYLFDHAGTYPVALVVQNKWTCADTIVKTIKVESDFSIFVPNAFTPNDDEKNQQFLPVIRGAKLYTLQIFNRWGTKIFETNDQQQGWDGTFKGESCKQDSYIYKITLSTLNGEPKKYEGFVILYR